MLRGDNFMMKLFKLLKPYKFLVIGVFILVFFQALSDLYLPNLMSDIVNTGIVNGDTSYITRTGGFMLLVAAIGAVCVIASNYFASKVAVGFGRDLRKNLFEKVETFSLEEFDKFGTSSLITRTTNDINQIQQVLIIMLRMMISAPMMAIGGFIMAVSKDAKLSLIILVVIPVVAVIIGIIAKMGIPLFKSMQIKLDKLNLVLREQLTGIRVIRAFNRIEVEKKRFSIANKDITETAIKVNRIMGALMPAMMLCINITTIIIVWISGKRIDAGAMQVGDLMAFIQYLMQIMFSLMMLSMMFVLIPRASVSADRINKVLDEELDITDPKIEEDYSNKRGYIEFKDVCFAYPGSSNYAIENLSFATSPGETTAIIGGTGSGKSTVVNLIPRFYDVSKGSILIDGVDIKDMSQEHLRYKIGFVPQKAVLFSGTINENIRYGKEDATQEEIIKAADIAQASEFINNMEEGYESMISQGGTNVSGGQKQRLSIARALVRRPEIYVFDDSFSALDFKTDAKLRKSLKEETKDSAVIIVAQRVSSIMDANRIIVLDDGKVAGMGTHKELLENCKVYYEIVSSQLSEEELENERK